MNFTIFDDEGNAINPDLYPKPSLCLVCQKNEDPAEKLLCDLNRVDQRNSPDFKCGAFDSLNPAK